MDEVYFTELIWENILSFLLNGVYYKNKEVLIKYKRFKKLKRKLEINLKIDYTVNYLNLELNISKSNFMWLKDKRKKVNGVLKNKR